MTDNAISTVSSLKLFVDYGMILSSHFGRLCFQPDDESPTFAADETVALRVSIPRDTPLRRTHFLDFAFESDSIANVVSHTDVGMCILSPNVKASQPS